MLLVINKKGADLLKEYRMFIWQENLLFSKALSLTLLFKQKILALSCTGLDIFTTYTKLRENLLDK